MLEKARQAERLTAERDAAQERYERYRTAVTVRDEIAELERTHPSPTPLPVLRALRRPPARRRRQDRRRSQAHARGRGPRRLRGPARVRWRPLSRWSLVLVAHRRRDRDRQLRAELRRDRRRRRRSRSSSAASWPGSGSCSPSSAGGCAAASRPTQPLRDVEVDRRLRGRSEIEQELREAQAEHDDILLAARAHGVRGGGGAAAARGGARRRDRAAAGAPVRASIGDEKIEVLPARRDNAALEIEQKTPALEALGPIAKEPRARERLEVEVVDAERQLDRSPRRRGQRPGAGRAEPGRRRGGRGHRRAPRHAGARRSSALRRRERVYERTLAELNTAEQATMQLATRYLERRMVARPRRGSPAAATAASGSTTQTSAWRSTRPERDDWVAVTDAVARARSTSCTSPRGSGSCGSSPATAGRRSSSTTRS